MTAEQEAAYLDYMRRSTEAWEAIAASMAKIAESLDSGTKDVGKMPASPPIQAVAPGRRISA